MKKVIAIVLTVIMVFCFSGCTNKKVKGEPVFGNKTFSITNFCSPMGEHTYNGVTYQSGITNAAYKDMKDSGIDLVLGLWDDAIPAGDITQEDFLKTNTYKALEAAKANGMKYFVMDNMLRGMARSGSLSDAKLNKIPDRLAIYMNHDAFGGIHLDDEPSATHFANTEKVRQKIEQTIGKDKDIYVNLFGSRATVAQLSGSANKAMTYDEYMKQFNAKTNFTRVSYDNYPFYYKADDTNPDMVMWFENLETAAKYATKDKPINICVQSCDMDPSRGTGGGDFTESNYYAQIRSQNDISFQLYTGMAFGVQQFTYFTYWTPNDPEIVKGMITLDGKKTDIYEYVKQSNEEIKKFENEFLSYDYVKTIAVPKNGEDLTYLTSMLTENISETTNFASSEEVVVGEFKMNSGHNAFMIANATEPRFKQDATTVINFKKKYDKAILIVKGEKSVVDIIGDKLEVNVGSGSGVFVMPYNV